MGRRRAEAQDARADLQGKGRLRDRRRDERRRHGRLGLRRPLRRTAGPAATPRGYPSEIADVVRKQRWAPEVRARAAHRVVAWDAVGETEGTGIVHIAPGCGKEDFLLGKEQGLPPVAPLDDYGVFLRRLRRADRQVRRRSRDDRLRSSTTSRRKACCSPSRSIRTAIRIAGAARRNCCSAWSMNGSST